MSEPGDPAWTTGDRRVLAAVAAQFFVNGAMTASFVARAPELRDQVGVTVDRYGLVLMIAGLSALAASLSAGRIVHRLGTFRVLLGGGAGMVVALPFIGSARSATVLVLALVAYSLVDVLVDISMNLQGSWVSARRRVPVMNRLHGLWSLGAVSGGLGAAVAGAADVSLGVHLVGVAVVSAVFLASLSVGLSRVDEDGHGDRSTSAVEDAVPDAAAIPMSVVVLVVAAMSAVVVELTGGDWASFRLADDLGSSSAVASTAFVAFMVGMVAVRFGGDWIRARFGRHVLHRGSVGAAVGGMLMASFVDVPWVAVGAFALVGAGVATLLPELYDDAARLPGRRGSGLGLMTAGTRVASLATPVVVGTLAGTSLGVGASMAIVTLPAAVAFVGLTEASHRRSVTSTTLPNA
ncbi:MAG: hypothetical protein ACO4AY_12385 [Ilumatobacteraceae bacterium]